MRRTSGASCRRHRRGAPAPLDARVHAGASAPTTGSRCRACSRSAPVLAERELGGAGGWAIITTVLRGGTIAGAIVALRWKPPRPMLAATLAFIGAARPAGDHRAGGLDRRDRRLRGGRRRRGGDRLRPVGDDARAAIPPHGAVARHVARLVHDRRADAARLRGRRPGRRRASGCTRRWSPPPCSTPRCSSSRSPCTTCAA